MDRRTFLKTVAVAAPVTALLRSRPPSWKPGSCIGINQRFDYVLYDSRRPDLRFVGIWDGRQIQRSGVSWVTYTMQREVRE